MGFKSRLLRWAVVLFVTLGILLIPAPSGVTPQSWRLLAIFAATITGSIVRPLPGAAMVLLGVTALPLFNVMKIKGPQVILDGNHPLAGKALKFSVTVTGVRAATEEEIAHRHVHGEHGHHH